MYYYDEQKREPIMHSVINGFSLVITGIVIFSREAALQVPSALRSLTSVFGMGKGVSSLLYIPDSNK